jgi:hypothetical protein
MRQRYEMPRVAGLMRPYPDTATGSYMNTLTVNDINSDAVRQQIITNCKLKFFRLLYSTFLDKIPGSGESFTDYNVGTLNYYMPTDNMFSTSKEEDKKFEVFPEAIMKSVPIYKTSEVYESLVFEFSNMK